jgi:hypothetical protein
MPIFESTYPAIGSTKIICVQLGGYNFRFFPLVWFHQLEYWMRVPADTK